MAEKTAPIPLSQTKLHRPPLTRDLVPRKRLLDHLEYHRWRPLTLVSAPAGYGKSTLICHWLEICEWPSSWISLDEYDSDLRQFLTYLVAAVRTLFPEVCRTVQSMLNATDLPPVPVLARGLVNELDRAGSPGAPITDPP